MKTDILEYRADQAWLAENYLATAAGQPHYDFFNPTTMEWWNMKGSGGFPWDSWHVAEDYIYQRVTENDKAGWTTPGYASSLKLFCSASWPNGKGGIAWAQRYFNEGGPNPPIVTLDSSYQYFAACLPVKPVLNLAGPVMNTIEGPYRIKFGGDLALPAHGAAADGTQLAAVLRYYWSAGFKTEEVNYHIKPSGPGMPGGRC